MHKFTRVIKTIGITTCLSVVMPVFAQSAPVYDADNMQADQYAPEAQYLPPPPPQAQDSGSTFVAIDGNQPANNVAPPSASMNQGMDQVSPSSEAVARLDSLQEQVQTLRGQVERLTHQLEVAQNQQKTMYDDLDKRLSAQSGTVASSSAKSPAAALEVPAAVAAAAATVSEDTVKAGASAAEKIASKTPSAKTPATKPTIAESFAAKSPADQPNVAEEQQIYQTAYNLIKSKKYNEAVNALQGMLKKYPKGQFASNAHYWLGELFGLMGKNDQALAEFSAVVLAYPDSPRVSDAQLKVGLILASQLKWPDAKTALKKVVNRYPGTASARLALEQLKQIKQAGH